MIHEKITVKTEYIKLDSFIKFAGVTPTGGSAKELIIAGLVKVNGEVCNMRGKKLYSGDTVEVNNKTFEVCGS